MISAEQGGEKAGLSGETRAQEVEGCSGGGVEAA